MRSNLGKSQPRLFPSLPTHTLFDRFSRLLEPGNATEELWRAPLLSPQHDPLSVRRDNADNDTVIESRVRIRLRGAASRAVFGAVEAGSGFRADPFEACFFRDGADAACGAEAGGFVPV